MGLHLLLFKKMDHESKNRIIMMILTIMIGVAITISYCAAINALFQNLYRFNRSVYYNTSYKSGDKNKDGLLINTSATSSNLLMWGKEQIVLAKIASSNANVKNFYGLQIPKNGTYLISPKLENIIKSNGGLKQRLGLSQEKMAGLIPDDFLQSPDDLIVFSGMDAASKQSPDTMKLTSLLSVQEFAKSVSVAKIILVVIGTITLLFPVMMLISIASQLGSMQKERRYAAMRLVGATKRQINRIITTESLITALVGIALGTGLFYLVRPLYGNVTLGGERFFMEDINISLLTYMVIVVVTILLCVFTDMVSMRKMKLSPLGVMKKDKVHKNPHIWQLIPLILGIGTLIFLSTKNYTWYVASQKNEVTIMLLIAATLILVMIGLVVAGPYLTMIISKLVAKSTKQPVLLLATKRIKVLSSRTFRAVGGVVIALYVGCFYLSAAGGVTNAIASRNDSTGWQRLKNQSVVVVDETNPSGVYAAVKNLSGAKNVLATQYIENSNQIVLRCNQLPTYFDDLKCSTKNAATVKISLNDAPHVVDSSDAAQPNAVILTMSGNLNVDTIRDTVAKLDGGINSSASYVQSGEIAKNAIVYSVVYELAELAYAAIVLTIAIAIISLFVSTMGGMLERKASFYNLNLGGMTVKQLRCVMLIESMLLLIMVAIIASGLGFLSAEYMIRIMSPNLVDASIPLAYYCIVAGLIIVATVGVWILSRKVKSLVTVENNQTE